ncbi:SRPBCC family protein [uncultured Roseovarius sp.]|uniref:SRPBCC family protein n=1 Tax=uncultured Roseovarius sp. TaxID=293344 RepID=UPI002638F4F9|nr:SRPBCC family protein [uncultured Roseovarius sp.]
MQFTSKEDIEAPIERVFAEVTDFHAFERSALRRGADVKRTDVLTDPGVGMSWYTSFRFRGKQREVNLELSEYDPPNGLVLDYTSSSVQGRFLVELVALSRGRTRMTVTLVLEPRTMAARFMLQSLKLARGNLNKRFKLRLADYAMDVEERSQRNV